MSHHHFTPFERGKIEELNKLGYSSRAIGLRLGRHHSSIARELSRFQVTNTYTADSAQRDYEKKRKQSKPRGKWSKKLVKLVTKKLKSTWSPEQISNTKTKGKLSCKTIYNWIHANKLPKITMQNLRYKGNKKTSQTAIHFARGVSIRKRPKEVYNRETFGHWELDTVVSKKGQKACVATFVERKTRFYIAIKMPDRTSESMENAIKCLYSQLPQNAFLTATTDRGGEFACFENIKKDLGLTLYFADPYCPHQRGSNEYSNGLLREFYPKGTNFKHVSQSDIFNSLLLINNRPRKCLNWVSPIHAFLHELSHLT